jgi:hypothetical protein
VDSDYLFANLPLNRRRHIFASQVAWTKHNLLSPREGSSHFAILSLWAQRDSNSGGFNNIAGGQQTVVIGGANVTDNNTNSIAPNPPFP